MFEGKHKQSCKINTTLGRQDMGGFERLNLTPCFSRQNFPQKIKQKGLVFILKFSKEKSECADIGRKAYFRVYRKERRLKEHDAAPQRKKKFSYKMKISYEEG